MVVYCTVCNNKSFVNTAALRAHERDSPKHRKPGQRQATYTNSPKPAAASSIASSSTLQAVPTSQATPQRAVGPNYCKVCHLDFPTEDELNLHYKSRASTWHPNCIRCGEGFENHVILSAHMQKAHPMKLCVPCQKYIYIGEVEKHIAESPIHNPYSCAQCAVRFSSEELLKNHYRDDGASWHKACDNCFEGFENEEALRAHIDSVVFCGPCNREISEVDLGKHWTESSNHPTCTKCNVSFESEWTFKQHAFDVHPELCCRLCSFAPQTLEGLQEHFDKVSSHPKCLECGVGFRNIVSLEKHACPRPQKLEDPPVYQPPSIRSASSSSISTIILPGTGRPTCVPCGRAFKHPAALDMHYRDHSAHPTCKVCSIGFKDAAAYDLHVSLEHLSAPSKSGPTEKAEESNVAPSVSDATAMESVMNGVEAINVREIANQSPAEAHQSPDGLDGITIVSGFSTPRSESDVADVHRSLILDIRHPMVRASSEPPLSSVFAPSAQAVGTDDGATSHSEAWADGPRVRSQAEDVITQASSPQLLSTSGESESSVTPSPTLTPQAYEREAISPMPSLLPPVLDSAPPVPHDRPVTSLDDVAPQYTRRRYPFHWGGSSPASESTSGLASPSSARSLLFSKSKSTSTSGASASAPPADENVSQAGHSRGERSVSGRVSRSATTESSVSSSRGCRDRSKSTHAENTPTTTTSNTHVGHEETRTPTSPKPTPSVANTMPAPAPGLAWHCRVCSKLPSAPTVTLCGHLFCRECIMVELQKHGQCPECRFTMLVRLHVEA